MTGRAAGNARNLWLASLVGAPIDVGAALANP